MRTPRRLALGLAVLALAACSKPPEPEPAAPPPAPKLNLSYAEMPPTSGYPLKTCVVTGNALTANRYVIAYKGYEVQFCSKDCLKEFATDPEGYVRKVNPKAIFDR